MDGKTLRGSRTRHSPARHVLAAADQQTGIVLASTDVDTKTNEMTADALHCQREHVAYLASRGAHWIWTVKANQPSLHQQLTGLPWRLVSDDDREKPHAGTAAARSAP